MVSEIANVNIFAVRTEYYTLGHSLDLIVANQATGLIVVFKRDLETGLLTKTNTEIWINSPSSLKMIKYGS